MAGNSFQDAYDKQGQGAAAQPPANPFMRAYQEAGGGAAPTTDTQPDLKPLMSDPDFQKLVEARTKLGNSITSPFNGPSDPHLEAMFQLQDKLIAKYGDSISPTKLMQLVNAQVPQEHKSTLTGIIQQYNEATGSGGSGNIANPIQQAAEVHQPAATVMLGISNVLAPLQIPQQVLFHGFAAVTDFVKNVKNRDPNEPLWQVLSDAGHQMGQDLAATPVWDLIKAPGAVVGLAPGVEESKNMVRFGDILKEWGVKNDTAVRVGGLAGDIFADPLLFGAWIGGVGLAAKVAGSLAKVEGLSAAGDKLVGVGRAVTDATSLAGAVKGSKAVVRGGARVVGGKTGQMAADFATNKIEQKMGDLVTQIMDFTPGEKGFVINGKGYSFGELVSGMSRNSLRPNRDIFQGGAGAPDIYGRSAARARATIDQHADNVNMALENIAGVFGWDRTKKWMQDIGDNLKQYEKVPGRLQAFPAEMQDQMMSLAAEVSDNMGVQMRPGAQALLKEQRLGTFSESASSWDRVTGGTFGDEVSGIVSKMPKAESNILHINEGRVAELAKKYGLDETMVNKAFNDVIDQLVAIDTRDGMLKSMYTPYKESLYQKVSEAGGDHIDAMQAWDDIATASLEGKNWRNVELPGLIKEVTESGDEVAMKVSDLGFPKDIGMMDLGTMFRAWRDGHLRRTYAVSQTPESFMQYLRKLRAGEGAVPNQIIDSGMYDSEFRNAVKSMGIDESAVDHLKQYVEHISPSIPQERGFIIPQVKLAQHLMDNGFTAAESKLVIGALMKKANPAMDKLIDDVAKVFAGREGAGAVRSAGPSTGKASTSARTLGYEKIPASQQKFFARMAKERGPGVTAEDIKREFDIETMQTLGRLIDAPTAMLESARATVASYPTKQFLYDVWKHADDNGLIFDSTIHAPNDQYVHMIGTPYGPLNGAVVPRQVKRWVDNALQLPSPDTMLATVNRFRQAVYASWLANPATTSANLAGNLVNTMFYGDNAFETISHWIATMKYVQTHGGDFTKLPEYDKMGELFQTGLAHTELARNMRLNKLSASGLSQEGLMRQVKDLGNALSESYKAVLQRPTRLLGKVESAVPGMRQFGSALGLDAFEYVENIAKLSKYRRMIAAGETADDAYRAAQHIVFDYAHQPKLVEMARDSGFVAFPGFPAFVAARQVNALVNRPGVLGAVDRLGSAIWNAETANEDQKRAIWANMREYQRDGGYIPIRINASEGRASMFPLKQIFPTSPIASFSTLSEGLSTFGFYAPIADIANAIGNQGAAGPSAKYGARVWQQGASTPQKVLQLGEFIANSYMPTLLRKMFTFGEGGKPPGGMIPYIVNAARPVPGDGLGETMDQLRRVQRAKLEKDFFEQVVSTMIRSTQPVDYSVLGSRVIQGRTEADYNRTEMMKQLNKQLEDVLSNKFLNAEQRQTQIRDISREIIKLQFQGVGRMMDALRGAPGAPGQPAAAPVGGGQP